MGGVVRFKCAGKLRFFPADIWDQLEGPKPAPGFECDGCSWSPDWMKVTRYAVWPACVIHDYHYRGQHVEKVTDGVHVFRWVPREQADAALYRNLKRVLRAQGAGRAYAESVAWAYWGRVRVWGAGAYQGPPSEPSWLSRVWEAWTHGGPGR